MCGVLETDFGFMQPWLPRQKPEEVGESMVFIVIIEKISIVGGWEGAEADPDLYRRGCKSRVCVLVYHIVVSLYVWGQNEDRIKKMQINSIVICINFIDNSIHVCSLSAQPPHTSLIVNATTATRKTVWALKLICTPHTCSIWYTTHIHCTCRFSAIFRTMETFKGPSTLQVKLLRFSLIT